MNELICARQKRLKRQRLILLATDIVCFSVVCALIGGMMYLLAVGMLSL
jgi:hypothetical protein